MRTEDDLRSTFDHLADTAPSADEILATLQTARPVRRSRTPLVLGAVVATVAAAIAAPLAVTHLRTSDPAPADADRNAALANWLTIPIPANLGERGRTYMADYQTQYLIGARVGAKTAASTCMLSTHRNGDFDPATIPAGSRTVAINNTSARLVTSSATKPVLPLPPEYFQNAWTASSKAGKSELTSHPRVPGQTMTTVVWEAAPGVWQLITCSSQVDNGWLDAPTFPDVDMATSLARTVKAEPRPLLSPYRITYLPDGLKARSTTTFDADKGTGAGHGFTIRLSDGDPATGAQKNQIPLTGNGRPEPGDDLKISYDGTKKFLKSYQQQKPDLTINGRPAWNYSGEVEVKPVDGADGGPAGITILGDGFLVRITGYRGMTQAEVLEIARGLEFAPSSDNKATWYDAASAIPGPR